MPGRQHRVTRGDDYRRIVRTGRRVGGSLCITHAALHTQDQPQDQHGQAARFGFIVSKAVGGAVVRNLIRRRLQTIAQRRLNAGFSGADIVFRALPASASASFGELEREAMRALDRVEAFVMAERSDARDER